MSYHITYDPMGNPVVVRDEDGACISPVTGNTDWRTFLAWNAAQASPLDYTTPQTIPPLTAAQQLDNLGAPGRLLAALAFRASASWADATTAQKAVAQNLLDNVGAKVLTILASS